MRARVTSVGPLATRSSREKKLRSNLRGIFAVRQAGSSGRSARRRAISRGAPNRTVEPLAAFMTNPAGSAIVNATGPIRQIVQSSGKAERRYLVITAGEPSKPGAVVQVQTP